MKFSVHKALLPFSVFHKKYHIFTGWDIESQASVAKRSIMNPIFNLKQFIYYSSKETTRLVF